MESGYRYLIINSFNKQSDAEHEITKLHSRKISAEIVGHQKPFRVGIKYDDLNSTKKGQKLLKNKYPKAWIL